VPFASDGRPRRGPSLCSKSRDEGILIPEAREVLAATGYLTRDGRSSEGLVLPGDARRAAGEAARLEPLLSPERGGLSADAVFRVGTSPVIIFKSSPEPTMAESEWHRTAWNFGVAPLLWVTTPQYVRLYNAYHPPADFEGGSPLLKEFPISEVLDRALAEIDAACGRRHVAMGSFWHSELARPIDRKKRIDNILRFFADGAAKKWPLRGSLKGTAAFL
jgi:hypothetical protein